MAGRRGVSLSDLGPAALRQVDAYLLAERVRDEQVRERGTPAKAGKNKFGAKRTQVDGLWFDSGAEARRYATLKLLENAGEIRDLTLQPAFDLHAPGGVLVGQYRADFAYTRTADGARVVEDVKSKPTMTPLYRWKSRHLQHEHGITITEVTE